MPKVSVVIATFNRAHLLPRAVESVILQTFSDWELLVIDDGSTDETQKVMRAYSEHDRRIRYVWQPNSGCARARNTGLARVQGDYIAFLDDDDVFFPQKLEVQAGFLDQHPEYGFVYSDADWVDRENRVLGKHPGAAQNDFMDLIMGFPVPPAALLVRKECFNRVGTFCTKLKSTDDYDMWLRIAKEYRFAYRPSKVARYHWHETNLTLNARRTTANLMFIYKRLMKQNLSQKERRQVIRAVLQFTYWHADEKRGEKKYAEAFFYYRMAFKFDPFIGSMITWGRFSNKTFRLLRPYWVTACCGVLACFDHFGQKDSLCEGVHQ